MNNYEFDYLNYMMNIPDNNNFKPNQYNQNYQNNQLLDPNQGFIKGNSFANLYDQYKNFKPEEITTNNEKKALLYQLMQYKFALIDLNLYLDMYPNDTNILSLYNRYLSIEKQICDQFEKKYGPLTTDYLNLNTNTWEWINTPWPWEGE